jgi:uncharacterized protein
LLCFERAAAARVVFSTAILSENQQMSNAAERHFGRMGGLAAANNRPFGDFHAICASGSAQAVLRPQCGRRHVDETGGLPDNERRPIERTKRKAGSERRKKRDSMDKTQQAGAPPRVDPNEAMLTAAKSGDIDGLRRALVAGADPMGATRMSRTALMIAASEGRAECVELLLPWSDTEAKSHWGGTALMRAAERGHAECARILLRAADADATDEEGKTALMLAAFAGHVECVELLLASANPKATNDAGDDALMCAAAGRELRCVRALLGVCDATAKNKKGRTALMIAVEHWQLGSSIVDSLVGLSDLMARDNEGRSVPDFVPHPGDPLTEPLRDRLRRLAAKQEATQLREGLGAEEKGVNAARRAPKTL